MNEERHKLIFELELDQIKKSIKENYKSRHADKEDMLNRWIEIVALYKHGKTQAEIAIIYSVTDQRIRQLIDKAERKLRSSCVGLRNQ